MAENVEVVQESRVNFHAVFAGVIIAMSLQLLLTILGDAVELSLIDPTAPGSVRAITIGPTLWTLGIPLFCVSVGSFIAAIIARADTGGRGALHGLLVWGLSLLFVTALIALSSIGPTGPTPAAGSTFFWLVFFSALLSLIGGLFGGWAGSGPLRRSLYRRGYVERRIET